MSIVVFDIDPIYKLYSTFSSPNPEGYEIRGLDISHHQGSVDWHQLVTTHVDGHSFCFVFMKATEGGDFVDRAYADNLHQAHKLRMTCGAYHYFKPDVNPEEQARHFIAHAALRPGDLAPVLDVEERGRLSADSLCGLVDRWMRVVEKHYGVTPILYTGLHFRLHYLRDRMLQRYPLWIAHYSDRMGYVGDWRFWQYSQNGRAEGVSGHVDCNIFNGTLTDLRRYSIPIE